MHKPISNRRKRRGTTIAEMPGGLILLLFGFTIPALAMATIASRVGLVYVLMRNAVNTASKANTYTLGKGSAQSALSRGFTAFPFLSGNGSLAVVAYPKSGTGTEQVFANPPLGSVDQTTYTYYERWSSVITVAPLISSNAGMFGTIPGLTGPINMNVICENYVENANGLTQ